ncbi:hypothetical protein SKAU_G00049100 [Synaphobranchus kaupii]|uniref:Uncharacterized protein n=1 Tax=Synaphobranchus kaupii TaxID=118154 RepID=A0A9Q1G402_SYNKA|nr:hypothetical protein SKAU_G00049100 [Synaphobranchus kaupii]
MRQSQGVREPGKSRELLLLCLGTLPRSPWGTDGSVELLSRIGAVLVVLSLHPLTKDLIHHVLSDMRLLPLPNPLGVWRGLARSAGGRVQGNRASLSPVYRQHLCQQQPWRAKHEHKSPEPC